MRRYIYQLATDQRNDMFSSIVKVFLYVFSLIYGFCLLAVRFLYWIKILKRYRLDCKVISVGNVTLGGTGKTPMVEFLANYLRYKGHKVGILIRGYGSSGNDSSDYKSIGDEAAMLKEFLKGIPVIVGRNRVKNGQNAIKEHKLETLIVDDGFQHWRLKRDLDIVLVNSYSSFGNRHLMPRGILREPLSSLKRADIFVLTKIDNVESTFDLQHFFSDFHKEKLVFEAMHKPLHFERFNITNVALGEDIVGSEGLKGKSICALSGIGDPAYFENSLKKLGIEIVRSFRYPDHHRYTKKDLVKIYQECRARKIDSIVTTQKDAVRLKPVVRHAISFDIPIYILRIEMKITDDKEAFLAKVDSLFQ